LRNKTKVRFCSYFLTVWPARDRKDVHAAPQWKNLLVSGLGFYAVICWIFY